MEHCKHCQATDRATAGRRCNKSPTGQHEWTVTTDVRAGSNPRPGTPGGGKPFATAAGKK